MVDLADGATVVVGYLTAERAVTLTLRGAMIPSSPFVRLTADEVQELHEELGKALARATEDAKWLRPRKAAAHG